MSGAYDARVCCQPCQRQPLAFEQARAPLIFEGTVRRAIHAFKYDGHRRVGLWLAARMAATAAREFPLSDISVVLPVPMHWLKRRLKGMNPAAVLAHTVAKLLHLPYHSTALTRIRWTPTQTRLTRRRRFANLSTAIRCRRPPLSHQTVLLVDDVLTSGATAHACALALRAAGAKRVFVLTAACAPQQQ